jgi:hypothetical protein
MPWRLVELDGQLMLCPLAVNPTDLLGHCTVSLSHVRTWIMLTDSEMMLLPSCSVLMIYVSEVSKARVKQ